jgi:NADPH:quinone reductase-like Zn-dependent oxidoreductase
VKAIVYSEFGPPDVLRLAEVAKPTPKEREILVKVRAAAVNPLDWHMIRGEPSLMRLFGKPKARTPGADVAGVVEAVGPNGTEFRAGDEVFGACSSGALAEYACGPESRFARKPAALGFEQAAAIPVAGVTALRALRNQGRVEPGQKVLVNGAAGGVGTFAVQLAKAFGAEVTGVCSTRNVELVRSLGAARVIDYTAEDFTRQAHRYDLILGVAGNATVADMRRALSSSGRLVVVGGGIGRDPNSGITVRGVLALMVTSVVSRLGRQRVSMLLASHIRKDELDAIAGLAAAGKLTPVIDRCYALADAAEAVRHLEAGHARGKVIVTP